MAHQQRQPPLADTAEPDDDEPSGKRCVLLIEHGNRDNDWADGQRLRSPLAVVKPVVQTQPPRVGGREGGARRAALLGTARAWVTVRPLFTEMVVMRRAVAAIVLGAFLAAGA